MRIRLQIVVFIVLCFVAVSWASSPKDGEPFGPVPAEELKMTSEPLAPGAPAIILYRQLDRDDSGVQGREYNYVRLKILTQEGRKYADIEIPFLKGGGRDISSIKARTVHPDGSIVNYEGKVYDKSIVKAKGVKYMAKTFTMPDVQVGSIIEYAYIVSLPDYSLYDSHWILSDELFTRKAKFSLKPYHFALRWSWSRLPQGTDAPTEAEHMIRLEVKNIPAFPTEDFMPPANELKARVDFTYSDSILEKDVDKFWKQRGKLWNSRLEDFVGRRKAMEEAVAQIVSPSDSPEVKLQKVYSRVQQIRNTSFELEKSEQEQKREKLKDINNVEDLWKRGYGNGIQLTWLFLGLARAAGFEAYGVWVSNRRNYFFNRSIMDDNKLDTNVVLVKLNGKDVYCDPGTAFTPFGLLPWTETGVPGLRMDKDGGGWVTTSLPDASASRIERKANLSVAETGDLEGELTVTFTGLEALRMRLDKQHDDDSDRKKYLEDLIKDGVPVAAEVQLTNKPDWGGSSTALTAEFKIKVPGWMSGAGRRAMLPTGIFTANEKNVFVHTERTHPIYFEFPFSREDYITITLPLGWEVSSLPPAQNEDGKAVLYYFKAEKDGGTLRLTRKLRVNLMLVETKFYPAVRNFFQVVRTGDEQQAVLQPIGSHAGK
jgi:hypothetical protein